MNKNFKNTIALMPTFVKNFSCLGGDCEDTCCRGWGVAVDKKTYLAYRDFGNNDKVFQAKVNQNVKRDKKSLTNETYAHIVMDDNSTCPFLTENFLCEIHGKFGHKSLSAICKAFPRTFANVDNRYEIHATPACVEILKVMLNQPDGIMLENTVLDKEATFGLQLNTTLEKYEKKAQKYYWDIKEFCYSTLQDRSYTFEQRLILLGILFNKIVELEDTETIDTLPAFIESMYLMIESNSFNEVFEGFKRPDNSINLRLTKELIDMMLFQGVFPSKTFTNVLNPTLKAFGLFDDDNNYTISRDDPTSEEKLQVFFEKYNESIQKYYVPFIEEKGYMVENFFFNLFMQRNIPFGSTESVWYSYMHLCSIFAIFKLLFAGIGTTSGKMEDENIVLAFYAISKGLLHSASIGSFLPDILKKNNLDSLAHMAILING